MAFFYRVPGNQPISNTTVVVNGTSLVVGLNGAKDAAGNNLAVTNTGNDLGIFPGPTLNGNTQYTLRVNGNVTATRSSYTDTVMATGDLGKPPADRFNVDFRFAKQTAHELVVRDVTQEIFGVDMFRYITPAGPMVDMHSFRAGDPNNVFDFTTGSGRPVSLRVYAAKIGDVERAYWLMLPLGGGADSLMVVISHGFGQNHAYYSKLNYGDPLSKPLLDDVMQRFILFRWGRQVAATRSTMGLLMPVRAGATGGELGPFANHAGMGAQIVTKILLQADAADALREVDVVTFSSGIFDANAFIGSGGKGLNFGLMINQDPALGTHIGGAKRKEYLSGWTASGPRAGFEFLPMSRWQHDPKFEEMKRQLGREYLHTWALPTYTLAMALR